MRNFLLRACLLLACASAVAAELSQPKDLTLIPVSPTAVKLAWKNTSTNQQALTIERRTGDGPFQPITSVPASAAVLVDKGLTTGLTYTYRLSTKAESGNPSGLVASVTLKPPTEPRGMLASSPSPREVTLKWTDRSDNEVGFRIERKTSEPKAQFREIARGIVADSYIDTSVVPGRTYTYHTSAYNAVGVSTFAEVTVKAGGAPPVPRVTKIPAWTGEAKVIYSKAFPGFMDIEIYREGGRYFVRDKIKSADYKDKRPRRAYYVDMENVGPSLEKGYPLPERGGIYQIQCKRWDEGKNQFDLLNSDTAMEWVIKPGPLGVEGELFIPPGFAFDTEDWRDQQHNAIPPFEPILGKASPSYRYNADQSWGDILSRGASHTASGVGPGGYEKMLLTAGDPLDAIGEQGFAALSRQELTKYASEIPPLAFYLTDWEKQAGWHNTPTYWSIDLNNEKILQNYYHYISELNRLQPERKSGDYYRALKWNNSFYDQGEAYPLRPQFMEQTEDPEKRTGPAFRTFTNADGSRRSMRDVCRVYTIDWYLKMNVFPERRRTAHYQIYCNTFDTINAKLITPADSTILGFAWFGTDNDLPYRQYARMEGGWLGYYNRIVPAAWWVMTATYIGHLFGDGFHWWHDQGPEGSDRKRRPEPGPNGPFGMGPYIWEPDADGPKQAPLVFGGTTEKGPVYPREPRYNVAYTKLAEYRLKQYESFLTLPRSVTEYSLDAGKSWVAPMGNERRDILEKAEKKQPLCFKWDGGGDLVMVFLSWPFAEAPEWNVRLKIAPGQERDVKMHRQWPMLRVFSKSNPTYGIQTSFH